MQASAGVGGVTPTALVLSGIAGIYECIYINMDIFIYIYVYIGWYYGVATDSRIDEIIGLFCKRAL